MHDGCLKASHSQTTESAGVGNAPPVLRHDRHRRTTPKNRVAGRDKCLPQSRSKWAGAQWSRDYIHAKNRTAQSPVHWETGNRSRATWNPSHHWTVIFLAITCESDPQATFRHHLPLLPHRQHFVAFSTNLTGTGKKEDA